MIKIILQTGFMLLTLLFSSVCFSGDVNIKKINKNKWITLETENFSILTDAKEKQAKEMAEELEHFRYFMAFLLNYEQDPLDNKVPVILAKNKGTFSAMGFSDNLAGIFVRNHGFVIFARADNFKSSAQGKGNWGRAVVLHELVHLLMSNSSHNIAQPFWYSEGIAEYFGTYMEKGGNIILGDMSVLGDRFYGMLTRNGGRFESVDTESLFKASQSDFGIQDKMTDKQSEELNKFYARSAAVVHYLNADSERRKKMYTYLALLKKGFSVDETFAHVFKMTHAELDKEVDEYMFSKYVMARTFPVGGDGIQFPEVKHTVAKVESRKALGTIATKLIMLPPNFLNNEERENMYSDIEKIYPDFFTN